MTHLRHRIVLLSSLAALGCSKPIPREFAIDACLAGGRPDSSAIATCLTGQYHWSADSAAATAHHISDSITVVVQRLHEDSISAAQAEAVLSGVADAADKDKAARPRDDVSLGMVWVGSRQTKVYYRGNCEAAKQVKNTDRQEFTNEKMAEAAGYKRSTLPIDEVCYKAPGL